jgi:uncharacterized protein
MENLERRNFSGGVKLENDESGKKYLTGYAILFNSESRDLGGFTEIVSSTALTGANMSDVVGLWNHDSNQLLGRSKSGTLKLEVDEHGLYYRIKLPKTQLGKDIQELVERGDITGSSFAFTIKKGGETWESRNGNRVRIIKQFDTIYDVSAVLNPAYPDTSVAMRSMEKFQELLKQEDTPQPAPALLPEERTLEEMRAIRQRAKARENELKSYGVPQPDYSNIFNR